MPSMPTPKDRTQPAKATHGTRSAAFETIFADFVECKAEFVSAAGLKCKYVITTMDHLPRFAILNTESNMSALVVAQAIIDRII